MNKFTKFILSSAMLLAIPTSSIAATFTFNGLQYETIDDSTARVKKWISGTDIVIPETVSNGGITYTVTEVGMDLFYPYFGNGYDKVTSIKVPGTVKKIDEYAIYQVPNLTTVELSEGLETIGSYAFYKCPKLTSISLPSTVININNAFEGCSALTDVYSYAVTPPTAANNAFDSAVYTNATLHIPADAENTYKEAACWKQFQNVASISNGVEGIETEEGSFRVVAGGIEIEGRADIYAIDGRIAATTDGGFVALPAGLYIVRGAKVLVK